MTEPASTSPNPADANAPLVRWLYEEAPYGVLITDTKLRITSWNRWLEKATGRTAAALAEKYLLEIFPELAARGLAEKFERALAGEPSVLSTAFHRYLLKCSSANRDDPKELMLQTARISPLYSEEHGQIIGTIAIVEDVTERERHAAEARQQYIRQKLLSSASESLLLRDNPEDVVREFSPVIADHLNAAGFAVYLHTGDKTWRVLHSNAESNELHSLLNRVPEHGALATAWADPGRCRDTLLSQKDSERAKDETTLGQREVICKELRVGKKLLGAFILIGKDEGKIKEEDLVALDSIARYMAVALDRADSAKALQGAHEDLERKVEERTSRLQETIQQLESFSYSIAHDLRAPIRAIKGYGDVLLQDFSNELPAQARNFIARTRIAAVKMELLTKDLLSFCQVSRDNITFDRIDLEELIHEICLMHPGLQGPGVVSVKKPLLDVTAHDSMLRQALTNLLENAIKFRSTERDLRIRIWTEPLTDRPSDHGSPPAFQPTRIGATTTAPTATAPENNNPSGFVRIWIEDNGIGISAENRQKVFGMFERLHPEKEYEGTGIGLAIVAKSVQRMGGACGVEGAPEHGSRFWIDLPAG